MVIVAASKHTGLAQAPIITIFAIIIIPKFSLLIQYKTCCHTESFKAVTKEHPTYAALIFSMIDTCGGDLSTVMLENPARLRALRSCSSLKLMTAKLLSPTGYVCRLGAVAPSARTVLLMNLHLV